MERAGANRSRSVASGRLYRLHARPGVSARPPNQPLLSHASLAYFFRDMCNCHTGIIVFVTHNSQSHTMIVASCHKSLVRGRFHKLVLFSGLRSKIIDRKMFADVSRTKRHRLYPRLCFSSSLFYELWRR